MRGKKAVPGRDKPPFERRWHGEAVTEDCILAKPKYAKQTQFCKSLFTSYVRSANAILSQPAADSPFHWIAVSGFAAYGYRVPLAGKRRLLAVT